MMWMINIPVYVSYVILLALEWHDVCSIGGASLQFFFAMKAILDTLYIWPSVVLFFWIRMLEAEARKTEEEDRREIERKITYEESGELKMDDDDDPDDEKHTSKDMGEDVKARRREIFQMRATRAIERLERYDSYNHSYLHNFRDLGAVLANLCGDKL